MGDEWIEGCSLITLGWHTIKREVLDRYSSGVNVLNVLRMIHLKSRIPKLFRTWRRICPSGSQQSQAICRSLS
jgi:hypothetical protein